MPELVSVIITTYKRPVEIVFRAINSVIKQTYSNIEIIVVDDSPETYTEREVLHKEIQKFAGKINYIQHISNFGACVARNTGLLAAKGLYVAFLDDDDEWMPEKIECQIKKFQDEETGLVYCGKTVVNDYTNEIRDEKITEYKGYVYDKLIYSNFIGSTSFPLIKREALLAIGGFDPLMQSAQDYDVWLRLAQKFKVDYVPRCLVKYHIHEGERISTNHKARIEGQERLINKNLDYLKANHKAWWWRFLRLSLQYARSKRLKKAIRIWLRCCIKQPIRMYTNLKYLGYIVYHFFSKT